MYSNYTWTWSSIECISVRVLLIRRKTQDWKFVVRYNNSYYTVEYKYNKCLFLQFFIIRFINYCLKRKMPTRIWTRVNKVWSCCCYRCLWDESMQPIAYGIGRGHHHNVRLVRSAKKRPPEHALLCVQPSTEIPRCACTRSITAMKLLDTPSAAIGKEKKHRRNTIYKCTRLWNCQEGYNIR